MASKELRFTERFTFAEYNFAFREEIEIEAIAWEYTIKPPKDDWARLDQHALVSVLRQIDELKASGEYNSARDQQRALMLQDEKVRAIQESFVRAAEHLRRPSVAPLVEDVTNFFSGMKSPDPVQRARFQRVFDEYEMGNKTPAECRALLAVAERAKAKGGRPKAVPPWRHEANNMEAMRKHLLAGATIPEAARTVAREEGSATQASRADYLERLYRQKLALRGK